MIEANLVQLVDDHGRVRQGAVADQPVEERGLAGAEEARQHREGKGLRAPRLTTRQVHRGGSPPPLGRRGRARGSGTWARGGAVPSSAAGFAASAPGLRLVQGTALAATGGLVGAGVGAPLGAADFLPGAACIAARAGPCPRAGPVKTTTGSPKLASCCSRLPLGSCGLRLERSAEYGESAGALLASSSSSLAGRLRCGPHISSCRLAGAASTGVSELTSPSDGVSHDSGVEPKPCSRRRAAFSARTAADGAPSTTAIKRRPSRVAVATRLKPEAQMKPVFMPSAPG